MKKYILLFLFMATATYCKAQGYDGSVNSLLSVEGKYQISHQPEKLYLQTDKSTYGFADTLWFKAYLFNASSLSASTKSRIVYIEISDENNFVQQRRIVVLTNGLGWGNIALTRRDFPEGGYTLRAYTQWMRNFDESLVFKKQFFVTNLDRDKWLINFNSAIQDKTAQLHLKLTGVDKRAVANQQVLLGVKQEEAILRRDKPQTTSPYGDLDLAVAVRDNPEPIYTSLQKTTEHKAGGFAGLSSSIEADKSTPLYKFPVIYNRAEKTDIQFMPEGGYLVAGINSIVGFKAIGEDGKGINISGIIVNAATNEEITSFASAYKGMGSFTFTPQSGLGYKAILTLPNNLKKEYALPATKSAGTVLRVSNPALGDSITVKISASAGMDNRYILIGQSRGLVCVAARVTTDKSNNSGVIKMPKSAFASGVVRFTLLNEQMATLNERIIYVDHKDNLAITVTPDKASYTPQDSIALHLEVKDSNGNPVQGAFSMSVIDDLQLNSNQSNNNASIAANLLLTSDLKGNIEDPDYYFSNAPNHFKALDNLLLTQGWTSFDWKDIFQPEKQPEFAAEPDISIHGRVVNLFNKGVKNATVNLLSLKPLYNKDVKTDDKGSFILNDIPQIDSAMYIRVRNNKGNSSTYEVAVDKPEWPVFAQNQLQMPWYVNTDTVHLKITDTLIRNAEKIAKLEGVGGKLLKEVDIKEKKIIPGSRNLNGPGNADEVIDEHDIAKEKPMTLLELLKKKVPGFGVSVVHPLHGGPNSTFYFYSIKNFYKVVLIFDGIDSRKFNSYTYSFYNNIEYDYYKDLMNYYTTENIKGVEVNSTGYSSAYGNHFEVEPPPNYAYIEITTYGGKGPIMKKTPADLVYKPIPAVSPKEFYRPAYRVKNSAAAAFDQRNTIHWEPNIITDKDGKATVTFYAAGQPATYTITTEGSNMNGDVGSSVQKLLIKANSP